MGKGTQFPRAEVSGHKDDATSAPQSLEIVVQAVVNDKLRDIRPVQIREVREFDQQTAQVPETAAENAFPLGVAHFGKGHLKVAQPGTALPAGEVKPQPVKGSGGTYGDRAGKDAECFDQRHSRAVLGEFFNGSTHAWYFGIIQNLAVE